MSNKPIKLWQYLVPIVVLLAIWFYPVPEGLKPQAWHMFAIFVATIVGILCAPLPSGALMFIALALSIFTNTLSFKAALSGFASGTVWMIFSAYVLSLGFVQSGLGRRIAYKTLSLFGGSSLGIAYSLGIADLILAPAMPSVTARSGGIILPISKSIDQVLDSEPGPKQKRLGEFLTMTCFQFTPITGATSDRVSLKDLGSTKSILFWLPQVSLSFLQSVCFGGKSSACINSMINAVSTYLPISACTPDQFHSKAFS